MGGYSIITCAAAESGPQERPTAAGEKELSELEKLGCFGALAGGGESTAPMATVEGYEGNGVSGSNEGSIKLVVDSRASEQYLDDHSGLRKRLSDYLWLDELREITTAGNHKLN